MTPVGRDLPTVQRPRRRRVSAGKIVAAILGVAVLVGGVAVFSVPGMSKPIRSLFSGESGRVLTYQVRAGALPISVEERGSLESSQEHGRLLPGRRRDHDHHASCPKGTKVKKGDLVCELDSAALYDQLVNQRITTKSAEANLPERQADARGGRDRRQGVRRGRLRPGPPDRRGRDQAGRVRPDALRGPPRVGQADVRARATSRWPPRSPRS